jgi:hypothetical protein
LEADRFYSVREGQGIVPAESIRPKKLPASAQQKP